MGFGLLQDSRARLFRNTYGGLCQAQNLFFILFDELETDLQIFLGLVIVRFEL